MSGGHRRRWARNPCAHTPWPEPTPGADSISSLHGARRTGEDVVLATFQTDFLLICAMELSFAANVQEKGACRSSTLGKRRQYLQPIRWRNPDHQGTWRFQSDPPGSDHAGRFVFRRYPSVRRQLIDEARQLMPQPLEQIVLRHAGLLAQRLERIAAERICQVVRGDRFVRAGADPGVRGGAVAALLES